MNNCLDPNFFDKNIITCFCLWAYLKQTDVSFVSLMNYVADWSIGYINANITLKLKSFLENEQNLLFTCLIEPGVLHM